MSSEKPTVLFLQVHVDVISNWPGHEFPEESFKRVQAGELSPSELSLERLHWVHGRNARLIGDCANPSNDCSEMFSTSTLPKEIDATHDIAIYPTGPLVASAVGNIGG